MMLIHATAGGTTLSGTLYERGEDPPRFRGAPDEGSPYVWLCDEFYQVNSGGQVQQINGEEVRIAFETPMPRGFDTREQALIAAKDHLRTQFARIGVPSERVTIAVRRSPDESGSR